MMNCNKKKAGHYFSQIRKRKTYWCVEALLQSMQHKRRCLKPISPHTSHTLFCINVSVQLYKQSTIEVLHDNIIKQPDDIRILSSTMSMFACIKSLITTQNIKLATKRYKRFKHNYLICKGLKYISRDAFIISSPALLLDLMSAFPSLHCA